MRGGSAGAFRLWRIFSPSRGSREPFLRAARQRCFLRVNDVSTRRRGNEGRIQRLRLHRARLTRLFLPILKVQVASACRKAPPRRVPASPNVISSCLLAQAGSVEEAARGERRLLPRSHWVCGAKGATNCWKTSLSRTAAIIFIHCVGGPKNRPAWVRRSTNCHPICGRWLRGSLRNREL